MARQVPTVSVLMPVHNGARFLEVSVNSILSQTVGDFELIIVDDGSTDKTPILLANLATTDSRIKLLHNGSRQGISVALNQAVRLACAPLIARMDADDWAHESRFAFPKTCVLKVLCTDQDPVWSK